MRIASLILTIGLLVVTVSYVYYGKAYRASQRAIVVAWGVLTCALGLGSYFQLIPLGYVILSAIAYGVISGVIGWQRRRDKHSIRLVLLTALILPVFIYLAYFNNDNASLPLHQWSLGSFIAMGLLVTMFAALFII